MSNEKRFGLINEEKPYTKEELEKYGLPETYTKEETLIFLICYILSTNSFKNMFLATLATNVSEET